jgi:hypothetical protein
MHAEVARAVAESRRLVKSNAELKYANKRLAEMLEKQRASERAGMQLLRATVVDVRRRLTKVETAVAHRTADTLQITQHLRRLADCVALSSGPSRGTDDDGGAHYPNDHRRGRLHRDNGGGDIGGGDIGRGGGGDGATNVQGLRTLSEAMHRGLRQLDQLYGGPDLFRTIFGAHGKGGGGGRRQTGSGRAHGGAEKRATPPDDGSGASSSSSASATEGANSLEDEGEDAGEEEEEKDEEGEESNGDGDYDDGGGGSERRRRRVWQLGLENRQLREDVLQLKWELKQSRAEQLQRRNSSGRLAALGRGSGGTDNQVCVELSVWRACVRANVLCAVVVQPRLHVSALAFLLLCARLQLIAGSSE